MSTWDAEDPAAILETPGTDRRITWAREARERAGRAAGRLVWAQGFSKDAKGRAADARRALEARRTVEARPDGRVRADSGLRATPRRREGQGRSDEDRASVEPARTQSLRG